MGSSSRPPGRERVRVRVRRMPWIDRRPAARIPRRVRAYDGRPATCTRSTMLHDPARHEPLQAIAWNEGRVRATIAHIVGGTVAAFTPERLWPPHPRDVDPGEAADAPVTNLYYGAAGVIWA